MKKNLKTLIGLFIPVKWNDGKYGGSISAAGIPLGLIMIVVAIIVNLVMN